MADSPASPAALEQHRAALTGHCYRMLGSIVDAEDAVQEAMVRAWRALPGFDGRSSLRTWLYRIATNACLDALADRKRRVRAFEERPVGRADEELETRPREHWLEPAPDERVVPADADPAEKAMLRQSVRLAFVAALQHLPPKQRAALLMTEVLGFSAAEVAESLETTVASVNSALQRARATLATRPIDDAPTLPEAERQVVDRYVTAFERYDMSALASLLHEDAIMSMPPFTLWLQGPSSIQAFMLGPGAGCRDSRLVRAHASGAPAFAQYKADAAKGGHHAWSLNVLELSGGRIARVTFFLDVETLFPKFGFPLDLPAGG